MSKIYIPPVKKYEEPDEEVTHCMVPGCPKTVIYARRMCRACYHYAANLVAKGHATWIQLEDMGLVGFASRPKGYPKRDWRAKHFKAVAPSTGMFPHQNPSLRSEPPATSEVSAETSLDRTSDPEERDA